MNASTDAAAIPPPSKADLAIDLEDAYETHCMANMHGAFELTERGHNELLSFIRRCHAAEQRNSALDAQGVQFVCDIAQQASELIRRHERIATLEADLRTAAGERDQARAELAKLKSNKIYLSLVAEHDAAREQAVKDEREACAKVAEQYAMIGGLGEATARNIAAAIRAR